MASDPAPTVLDTGALIAVERRAASMRALVEEAAALHAALVVPAPVDPEDLNRLDRNLALRTP